MAVSVYNIYIYFFQNSKQKQTDKQWIVRGGCEKKNSKTNSEV